MASTLGKNALKLNSEVPSATQQIIRPVRHTKKWHGITTATCSTYTVRLTTTNDYKLRLPITYLFILLTVYLTKPWLSQII
jgi:hypothetical protein